MSENLSEATSMKQAMTQLEFTFMDQETKRRSMGTGSLESEEKGSGARDNTGKPSLSLIPLHLLAGTTRVLMAGCLKYKSWNWAKGMAWSVCVDCFLRHFTKWWYCGEDIDSESGEHHLDHMICNLLFLKHYTLTYKEGDDRPPSMADFSSWLEDVNLPFNVDEYLDRNTKLGDQNGCDTKSTES